MAPLTEKDKSLGTLFEKASVSILTQMFCEWGYFIFDVKSQKSGSQHGFDIFFKIGKDRSVLNIFVECKASETYNSIRSDELSVKLQQFDWAAFPQKDVHVFFSPSRQIDLNNQTLTVEDDSYPFVILNWMRKEQGSNLILELFAAYRTYGANQDVLDYCDFLFSSVDSGFKTDRTFAEVCLDLKHIFDHRIEEHNGKSKSKNFRIINDTFWSEIQKDTQYDFISYFYIKTDSNPARLREVVANDFYVKNIPASRHFERSLHSAVKTKTALIKILSQGGEGKSTFLYHLAKTYCLDNIVIWLENIEPNILTEVQDAVRRMDSGKPLLFFLDNPAAVIGKGLTEFANKLVLNFRHREIVLIVAERNIRYNHIEDVEAFEALFNDVLTTHYHAREIREDVFDKLIFFLNRSDSIAPEILEKTRHVFLNNKKQSLAERTFAVLKYLKLKGELKNYTFDWEDWEKFAKAHAPNLEKLYLVVATFYQFGYSLDIDFCASFIEGADFISINSALLGNPNLPIYKRGRHLLLRHEAIASWYLDGQTEKTRINLENSKYLFKSFLKNIDTDFSRNLFIWMCIKNKEFLSSDYAKFVDISVREAVLANFINKNPRELKSRTELSKIYQAQKKWQEAEDILLETLAIDDQQIHSRTELSKIYQTQKKWQEAEDILLEELAIDDQLLHPRTELSKVYQAQKKWQEAEDILLESLRIDERQLHPRTELSRIYQAQKKWQEAEDILLESLRIDDQQLHPRTELSRIYQAQKKWQEAEDTLLESLEIDDQQFHPRTELSKIYQFQKKWKEAEDTLLESLKIDDQQLHPRTELSRIYQFQKKWKEAEDILLESLEIDDQQLHPRTELSKIYQFQKKWQEAEDILLESLEIDDQQLHPRTELSKIYQYQKKWQEAEDILLELKDLDPDNLQARTELSKIYQTQKKWQEAEDILLESLAIDDGQLHPRTELSKIYQFQKKWQEAENILLELKDLDSDNLRARTELSKIYQTKKRWKEAEEILLECLEIDNNDLNSRIELSKIYQAQNKLKEAEEILLECLRIELNDLHPRIELSKIYQIQNKIHEAESILKECLDIECNNHNALLELGKMCSSARRYAEAQEYFERLLNVEPDSIFAKLELAWLCAKTRNFPLREKLLFEIHKDYPDDIPSLTQLAHLFSRFMKYRIAIKLLEKAFDVNNSDLLTICELIRLYSILRDKVSCDHYSKIGKMILDHNPYNKYKEKFRSFEFTPNWPVTLTELSKVGYYTKVEGASYITFDGQTYQLISDAVVNNKLETGNKVYFGLYSQDGKSFANYVEPYFDNIDDLESLK